MSVNLAGEWTLWMDAEESISIADTEIRRTETDTAPIAMLPSGAPRGTMKLPGILQSGGYGFPIDHHTPWLSSLHDPLWYQREEYQYAQEDGIKVPFLAQPPLHYLGRAWYERKIELSCRSEYVLFLECTKWRTHVWIDGDYMGSACSLCVPHVIALGTLEAGDHRIMLCVDNRMQYPYRPDGHSVSDALGAAWNGVAGRIELLTADEWIQETAYKRHYAQAHPRTAEVTDGKFVIDGHLTYFRGTHFGGDYPLTGYPETGLDWWRDKMEVLRTWGFNFIRFHSYCPPEAAFAAADEAGIYLLVECGMWNVFEEGSGMLDILWEEMKSILSTFGHHPSFVLFSSGNEPGGKWYRSLARFVDEARAFDESLGYGGRRLYTPQSGWFYDRPPKDVEGPDFLYFHRSAYGPISGGSIRNWHGWKGKDYASSLEGTKLPVICHEMGQWCVYPDFRVIDKFTGYMRPGHLEIFRENARAAGLLECADNFAACSAENQFLLYKEDIEANLRTPQLYGYEMLDLRDYLGQGGALIGLLDAFWNSKGYVEKEAFRRFNQDTVLLTRISKITQGTMQNENPIPAVDNGDNQTKGSEADCGRSYTYVFTEHDKADIAIELCHFGIETIVGATLTASLVRKSHRNQPPALVCTQSWQLSPLESGKNRKLADWKIAFNADWQQGIYTCILTLENEDKQITQNQWDIYYYQIAPQTASQINLSTASLTTAQTVSKIAPLITVQGENAGVLYTKNWNETKEALSQGKTVLFTPWLSSLDYECPATATPTIFWNSQMGPTWSRGLGLCIDTEHPLFDTFPTEKGGGWQWEDILRSARGYNLVDLPSDIKPIVRIIDDWNRNLCLALIWEARVGSGKLLFVSANLEGTYENRPAAYSLCRSLLRYAASPLCQPESVVTTGQIEKRFFPVLRMKRLTMEAFAYAASAASSRQRINIPALIDPNPNNSVRLEGMHCPLYLEVGGWELRPCLGLYYLPDQRDRMHEGLLKDVTVEAYLDGQWHEISKAAFANAFRSQKIWFDQEVITNRIRLKVTSLYGTDPRTIWEERDSGFYPTEKIGTDVIQIGGLHIIWRDTDQVSEDDTDVLFWEGNVGSSTREIEN
jgi:hypothetical protein